MSYLQERVQQSKSSQKGKDKVQKNTYGISSLPNNNIVRRTGLAIGSFHREGGKTNKITQLMISIWIFPSGIMCQCVNTNCERPCLPEACFRLSVWFSHWQDDSYMPSKILSYSCVYRRKDATSIQDPGCLRPPSQPGKRLHFIRDPQWGWVEYKMDGLMLPVK